MTPIPVPPMRLFERALHEALDGSLSAERASAVIAGSLDRAGLPEVPEDLMLFEHYVRHALNATLVEMAGPHVAEGCIERLSHVLWMASSTVRAQSESPESLASVLAGTREEPSGLRTVEPPPKVRRDSIDPSRGIRKPAAGFSDEPSSRVERRAPTLGRIAPVQVRAQSAQEIGVTRSVGRGPVLVLTLDGTLLRDVEQQLSGHRSAFHVGGQAELVRAITEHRAEGLAVLIDAALPSVELSAFASLSALLPPDTAVVLWGIDARQKKRLATVYPQAASWIAGGDAISPAELLLDPSE